MKTPREILLDRHRDAESALDAARTRALASLTSTPKSAPLALRVALTFWRELIAPNRVTWASLGAAWIVILALHLSTGPGPQLTVSKSAPPAEDVLMGLREQKQVLAELLGQPVSALTSAPVYQPAAHPGPTGPRGEVRRTPAIV